MTKLDDTLKLIVASLEKAHRPVAMLSFGKDSMVLADLIRKAARLPGEFPVEVIYHRDPWFPHKHEFAQGIIRSWSMIVHDFAPFLVGVKVKSNMLELVARYNVGSREIDIPKNVCVPGDYPRRQFICGLNDWIQRPKGFVAEYPWDMVFIGHKSSDVDPFEGPVPLKYDEIMVGGVRVMFPLRHWNDDDVWDYIEREHVPVQQTRYKDRKELPDTWWNNDYTHACTLCIDPRETNETVWCPKLKRDVPNVSGQVRRLGGIPDYIAKEAA